MGNTKKKPAQLELFAEAANSQIHQLGLLGWRDPLWTTRFTITLLDGTKLPMTLITVRRLQRLEVPSKSFRSADGVPNSTS